MNYLVASSISKIYDASVSTYCCMVFRNYRVVYFADWQLQFFQSIDDIHDSVFVR